MLFRSESASQREGGWLFVPLSTKFVRIPRSISRQGEHCSCVVGAFDANGFAQSGDQQSPFEMKSRLRRPNFFWNSNFKSPLLRRNYKASRRAGQAFVGLLKKDAEEPLCCC